MGSKSRKNKGETDEEKTRRFAEALENYRLTIGCMARSLVADMFEQHRQCTVKECRAAGRCMAYDHAGFCPVEMDNREGCVLAGMTLFHDALYQELIGPVPQMPGSETEDAMA